MKGHFWRRGFPKPETILTTLPETDSEITEKWMIRRRSFPVGARPIFRGKLTLGFRDSTDPVFSLFRIFSTEDSCVEKSFLGREGRNDLNRSVSYFFTKTLQRGAMKLSFSCSH